MSADEHNHNVTYEDGLERPQNQEHSHSIGTDTSPLTPEDPIHGEQPRTDWIITDIETETETGSVFMQVSIDLTNPNRSEEVWEKTRVKGLNPVTGEFVEKTPGIIKDVPATDHVEVVVNTENGDVVDYPEEATYGDARDAVKHYLSERLGIDE